MLYAAQSLQLVEVFALRCRHLSCLADPASPRHTLQRPEKSEFWKCNKMGKKGTKFGFLSTNCWRDTLCFPMFLQFWTSAFFYSRWNVWLAEQLENTVIISAFGAAACKRHTVGRSKYDQTGRGWVEGVPSRLRPPQGPDILHIYVRPVLQEVLPGFCLIKQNRRECASQGWTKRVTLLHHLAPHGLPMLLKNLASSASKSRRWRAFGEVKSICRKPSPGSVLFCSCSVLFCSASGKSRYILHPTKPNFQGSCHSTNPPCLICQPNI